MNNIIISLAKVLPQILKGQIFRDEGRNLHSDECFWIEAAPSNL